MDTLFSIEAECREQGLDFDEIKAARRIDLTSLATKKMKVHGPELDKKNKFYQYEL